MKVGLILGNGFTIDFLRHVERGDSINVVNLFREGSRVRWPVTKEPGFLSFKYCPNLWSLGARTTLSDSASLVLIEDILTCANIFHERQSSTEFKSPYHTAYFELSLYLRHLFIEYDRRIPEVSVDTGSWGWANFFDRLKSNSEVERVVVATYNYDIWLERTLQSLSIDFDVFLNQTDTQRTSRFQIFKPHGSISFCHEIRNDDSGFNIASDRSRHECELDKLKLDVTNMAANYPVNPMIPPAGDSRRFGAKWAQQIREALLTELQGFTKDDHVFICGLSYWHVDRQELDEVFRGISEHVNVHLVNPNPPSALVAVLTSLYPSFVHHPGSEVLKEILQ